MQFYYSLLHEAHGVGSGLGLLAGVNCVQISQEARVVIALVMLLTKDETTT